jgi:hypothetical protein
MRKYTNANSQTVSQYLSNVLPKEPGITRFRIHLKNELQRNQQTTSNAAPHSCSFARYRVLTDRHTAAGSCGQDDIAASGDQRRHPLCTANALSL